MPEYIFTTKEELMEIVREAVSDIFSIKQEQKQVIDTLDLDAVLILLEDNGYKITKSQAYKLTSRQKMPHMKFGNKLVFSRKEILEWAKKSSYRPSANNDALKVIQKALKAKN